MLLRSNVPLGGTCELVEGDAPNASTDASRPRAPAWLPALVLDDRAAAHHPHDALERADVLEDAEDQRRTPRDVSRRAPPATARAAACRNRAAGRARPRRSPRG